MTVTVVGVTEAQRRFADLLRRAQSGEHIVITRRGAPVGELVPIDDARRRKMEAIAGLRRLAKGRKLNGMTIRQLIDEGRRF